MTGSTLAVKLVKLLQNAGISITVSQLEANAAQIATLPNNLLAPALIWSVIQLWENFPSPTTGFVYSGNYGEAGPQFTPNSTGAIAIDSVTKRQWMFTNNTWS